MVENKREEFSKLEFMMKAREPDIRFPSAMLKNVAMVYTPEIFAVVQDECIASNAYVVSRDEISDNHFGM
ncbi:hypothetical protein LINPERPRIM_LOCUS9699, partial [Linum perenne]